MQEIKTPTQEVTTGKTGLDSDSLRFGYQGNGEIMLISRNSFKMNTKVTLWGIEYDMVHNVVVVPDTDGQVRSDVVTEVDVDGLVTFFDNLVPIATGDVDVRDFLPWFTSLPTLSGEEARGSVLTLFEFVLMSADYIHHLRESIRTIVQGSITRADIQANNKGGHDGTSK